MTVIPREQQEINIKTNSRYLRELKESLQLSDLQRRILMGTLMGDGCLISNASKIRYRLQIEHCAKNKEYVFWKYEVFSNFVISPPKYTSVDSWKFRTMTHEEFLPVRELFYKDGIKILPKDLSFLFDPLVLAVWFMDDGGRLSEQGCLLNIQNFADEEAILLQDFFHERLDIPVTLHRNHGRYRLYIPSRSVVDFFEMVKDYIRPEFRYKFPLTRRDLSWESSDKEL